MPRWKKNLYAIWVAELLAIAGFNSSIPILPFYLGALGIDDPARLKVWVGLAHTMGGVTLAVFSPIWGRLADCYGRRPMLLRAMVGGAVVIGLMGFVRSPWQLILLRGLQGCLTGTVAAATVLVASTTPEKEVGYSLGLLQTAVFAGSSLGPLIGGVLSDAFGYRVPFWATAGLLVVSAAVVTAFVAEDFQPNRSPGSLASRLLPDFGILTRTRGLLPLLLTVGTVQIAGSVVGPIVPLFIQSLAPTSTLVGSTTGVILGASALAAAVASAAIGKVSHRVGYGRALLICIAGAAVFYIPQAFVHTTTQLLILRIVGALFLGGTSPTVNATIAGLADRSNHGSVYGLSSSVSSAGAALGPMIGAAVGVAWGFPAVFLTTAAILAATAASVAYAQQAGLRAARRSPTEARPAP